MQHRVRLLMSGLIFAAVTPLIPQFAALAQTPYGYYDADAFYRRSYEARRLAQYGYFGPADTLAQLGARPLARGREWRNWYRADDFFRYGLDPGYPGLYGHGWGPRYTYGPYSYYGFYPYAVQGPRFAGDVQSPSLYAQSQAPLVVIEREPAAPRRFAFGRWESSDARIRYEPGATGGMRPFRHYEVPAHGDAAALPDAR